MRAPPPRIGLTGGIGSGKSTVAAMFAELGAAVIDNDAVARELTAPGGAAIGPIRDAFGAHMIDARGALDRARMREHVFARPDERQRLEGILHPMIRERSEELAQAALGRAPLILFDIPLLAEGAGGRAPSGYDRVLVVDCPVGLQLERAGARAGMPAEQVRAVIAVQARRSERLDIADDVIFNAGSLDALRLRVTRLWQRYCGGEGV